MKTKTFTKHNMDAWANNRDDGYLTRLSEAIVEQDETSITYDVEHEAYVAEKKRWSSSLKNIRSRVSRVPDWVGGLKALGIGAGEIVLDRLGVRKAMLSIASSRRNICDQCDLNMPCVGKTKTRCCGGMKAAFSPTSPGCGCIISSKVRRASQSCPHPDGSKWVAVPVTTTIKETING